MQIAPNIHFLQRGWENANAILITGDEPAIIDPGHTTYAHQLPEVLSRANLTLADIRHIINTHSHWDHTSANDDVRRASDATVGMGELTATYMREGRRREMWLSYFGVNPPLTLPDWTFAAGDTLTLGGMAWEVVPLPGHAPDLLGFYQPDERVLVSADALLPNGDCGLINVVVHGWDALDEAMASAERIASMDIRVVLPGHGAPITDVAADVGRLQKRLASFKSEPQRLITHLARRVLMASLLTNDPIAEPKFRAKVLVTEWINDYAPMVGVSAETLYTTTLTALLHSGAVRQTENGVLIGQVPR